jgi:hypothetical protein
VVSIYRLGPFRAFGISVRFAQHTLTLHLYTPGAWRRCEHAFGGFGAYRVARVGWYRRTWENP